MGAGPWTDAPRGKRSPGKRQSAPQGPHAPPGPGSRRAGASQPAEEEHGGSYSPDANAQRSPQGPRGPLLLDVQAVGILKAAADEDSASDLSDSERVPIAPSPRSPPDLRLRAEEIDPGCFDLDLCPGRGPARPESGYPDFLPPPWNAWDLRDVAVLVYAERRPGAPAARAGGLLGRFVDRLLQLEWLQLQTLQAERAKGGKTRPPAAPLKSPGRGRVPAAAGSRRPQDGAPTSGPSLKKGFHRAESLRAWDSPEAPPKPREGLGGGRRGSRTRTLDARPEEERPSQSPRGPRPHRVGASSGHLRSPPQPAATLDSTASQRPPKTQAHAHVKKKGNAND